MLDRIVALIVDESKWLATSMALAALAVIVLGIRCRRGAIPARAAVPAAMNLFFGITIGTMAFGHVLAVATKLALGTLEGSVPLLLLMGVALAVPSLWLGWRAWHDVRAQQGTLGLNLWSVLTLIALGIHNFPLAPVSYTHLRAHETAYQLVWRLLR